MTAIDDLADDTGDVYLARNADGMVFRLDSRETVPADELGTDEYPQYGDFAPVGVFHPPKGDFVDDCYLEIPVQLAKTIVTLEIETGDVFKITDVTKANGQYHFVVDDDYEV